MKGNNFKKIVKRLGLTQEEAANALHVTRRTLANWIKNDKFQLNDDYLINTLEAISREKKSEIKIFTSDPISFEYKNVKKNGKQNSTEIEMLQKEIEYLKAFIKIQEEMINMLKQNKNEIQDKI